MAVRGTLARSTRRGRRTLLMVVALLATLLATPAQADDSAPLPAVQRLGETVLDPTARGHVTYAATANVASYQQDAVVTYKGVQYAAWYAADRRLVVSRRTLPNGAWQSLRLDAVLWADDSHNNVTIGISPRDGRLHLALATHGPHVRYVRSLPGVAGGATAWASMSFEPVRGHLPGAIGVPKGWTYPTFELHRGDLLLTWRDGTPTSGQQALARYDGAGNWQVLGAFTGPAGAYDSGHGRSTSRYSYLHGFTSNPVTGALEITWTWREDAATLPERCRVNNNPANRDLGYARSDDGGRTWRNEGGQVIGRTGTSDVITSDDPHVVVEVPVTVGMMNSESQAVDSAGRVHVLTSRVLDADLAALGGCLAGDFYEQRAQYAHAVHHWRAADGWRSVVLPYAVGAAGRSQLVFGADDTAYVVLPDGRVAAASAADEWATWHVVFDGADVDSISEQSVDRLRLADDGVLSVLRQETGRPAHGPSALVAADFALGASGVDAGRTQAAAPGPFGGSAPTAMRTNATSAQPNMPPHFAVDGDPATAWMSGAARTQVRDGLEWARPVDATRAFGGAASAQQPQLLRVEWDRSRWVGRVTLDPGGVRGPKDWRIDGRVGGRWVALGRVTGQPRGSATYALPRTRVDSVRVVVSAGHSSSTVEVAELVVADRVPDNRMSFGRVARKPKRAQVVLPVAVREAGTVRVLRTAGVKARRIQVAAARTVRPVIALRGAKARKVSVRACRARGGRVATNVRVKVRMTPVGGKARTVARKVRVVRTC